MLIVFLSNFMIKIKYSRKSIKNDSQLNEFRSFSSIVVHPVSVYISHLRCNCSFEMQLAISLNLRSIRYIKPEDSIHVNLLERDILVWPTNNEFICFLSLGNEILNGMKKRERYKELWPLRYQILIQNLSYSNIGVILASIKYQFNIILTIFIP